MKIAFLANAPWTPTGYGNQTRLFAPRITQLGHPVACLANWGLENGLLHWNGIPVYPRAYHQWGLDVLGAHCQHFGADLLISLVDAWVMEPRLVPLRWAPWFPVDSEPVPAKVADAVRQSWQPIVYSQFGQRMAAAAGIEAAYVPHGVECNVFKPGNRAEARTHLRQPADAFLVGMVAANKDPGDRKAFRMQVAGFAAFHSKHPDSRLFLHTVRGGHGEPGAWDLTALVAAYGLSDAVVFSDQYGLIVGQPDVYMAALYNACDVLLSVSMGEGFGIPILEAQSCGCPVIVGDWTAMGELCFAGEKLPKEAAVPEWTPLQTWQWRVRPEMVAEALERAYSAAQVSGSREAATRKARTRALDYDADRVAEKYWKPLLAQLEARMADERQHEAPPSGPVELVRAA